jgi:putative ABC transport system permease protein
VLFGLAPALRAARVDLSASMKAGGRNTQGEGGLGSSRGRLRGLLVVAEVAISLVLLIGAGLLIRSFVQLQRVSPGFEPAGVVSMRVGGTARQLPNRDEAVAYYRPINDALAAVPGVQARGFVTALPFTASVGWGSINVEGWTPQPGQELQVDQRGATIDYFRTMKIPLTQGRFFEDSDLPGNAAPVAIIDQKFADRFWPEGAIGKQVWFDPKQKITIIGVVGTVKQYGLDVDGRIVVYRPSVFAAWHVARTSGDPAIVGAALARKLRELDPTITIGDMQTMTERMGASMARQRFSTVMLGAFAAFALILAVVGVYGVMQGAHDIGVRMALGAERRGILAVVLRQGMELAVGGIVLGLVGAFALTRVMAGFLFNVSTMDVATFSLVPLALAMTAAVAIIIPAMRATCVDPVIALRDE